MYNKISPLLVVRDFINVHIERIVDYPRWTDKMVKIVGYIKRFSRSMEKEKMLVNRFF